MKTVGILMATLAAIGAVGIAMFSLVPTAHGRRVSVSADSTDNIDGAPAW